MTGGKLSWSMSSVGTQIKPWLLPRRKWPISYIGPALAIFIILPLLFRGCGGGSTSSTSDDPRLLAYVMSQSFVEDKLKCPATASFPPYATLADVRPFGVQDRGGNLYVIMAYVDSQNSFGANVRTRYTCWLRRNGSESDKWSCESLDMW